MKKRILLAISVLLVFGLAIAAYAYTANTPEKDGMSCCCKSGAESCPMMKDKTTGKDAASCCEKEDCCCKSGADSCPMKGKKDESKPADKQKPSCCDKKEEAPKKDG